MNKEESHRPTRCSKRILQLYEKQKRKLETFSLKEGNETCQKRMRYNQQDELRCKIVMKKDKKETSDGARQNVNHSYGTRLQAKRKREFEFCHVGNDGFGKKRKLSEFSNEKNGSLKKWRKHVEISDKDIGYMHRDINERNRKRKSCEFLSKVDVQKIGKRNCQENNQAGNVKNPQKRYNMKENQPLTATNENIVFKQNENLAKASIFEDEFANESIQRMQMAYNGLDTHMEECMHQIENREDQNVLTRNVFQNQILEEFGNNFNSSYYFLELKSNQEDINNNKQISQRNFKPHFTYNHSCIERADSNMNETFLIIQRLDGIDITNIGLCKEPFAATDDLSQDHSCPYPSIEDLKIQVGHYEDNYNPSLANRTTTGNYMESMNTSTGVTLTKVIVKQEPMWDDYEKETNCTEDDENDSEDIDMPSSTRSQLRIRPIKRRKRALIPLRIRLLKTLTMRKAWKESTTCCYKYCWIDWPTASVGQI